jgi:hypothetical protein
MKKYPLLSAPKTTLNEMRSDTPMVDYQHMYFQGVKSDKYSAYFNAVNQQLDAFMKVFREDVENNVNDSIDIQEIMFSHLDNLNAKIGMVEQVVRLANQLKK